jgi:hypothetical protein
MMNDDDEDTGKWLGIDTSGRQPVILNEVSPSLGHNSRQLELDRIVADAVRGLKVVSDGEAQTIAGWIIYGKALNEGRGLFKSNEHFGQWVSANLAGTHDHDRAAAMWAADNTDLMYQIMEDSPRIKTVRGAHAKYKKDKAEEENEDVEEHGDPDDVVDDGEEDKLVPPNDGKDLPSDKSWNNTSTKGDNESLSLAKKLQDEFNKLTEEEKIARLGGEKSLDAADQRQLDETLEDDFNPNNAANSVLISISRIGISGGYDAIEKCIMQELRKSPRMQKYEAAALLNLANVINNNYKEITGMVDSQPTLKIVN